MECTKSNVSPKNGEKKNVFAQILDLWKTDVNWDSHTDKDRKVCIWFGLSLTSMIALAHTWLIIPAAISLVCSLGSLSKINVEE